MVWEDKADFERYWYSPEIAEARESVVAWYDIPLLPDLAHADRRPVGRRRTASSERADPVKLGIVGLGYVGLPLALAFTEAGNDVVGARHRPRPSSPTSPRAAATSRTSPTPS